MRKTARVLISVLLCAMLCAGAAQASSYAYDSGYGETSVYYCSTGQLTNIYLAADAINGITLGGGQRFSFNDTVGPRSAEKGYVRAVNGRGAKVRGGGVSQVATTLLLAVEDFGWMNVEDYMAYGDKFTGGYVYDTSKAVVTDYEHGHDLAFTNCYPGQVVIYAWVSDDALHVTVSPSSSSGSSGYSYSGVLANGVTPMPGEYGQRQNVNLAASLINGCQLRYGDRFSFNGIVGPRTKAAGFVDATNGRGVKVTGGGVAQVASTVYLAVKQLDSITVDPVKTYGDRFTGGYVADSADAIVTDYNAGTDFSFTYYGVRTLLISLYEQNGMLWCTLTEIN
ncbi:MAG: VanW family protein [Clostridia bacterium]|nr:VanW family protein [Clostridia bacterium]